MNYLSFQRRRELVDLCVFPEIAASFGKAYHFNTFGGSPIACAVASSVLDVRNNSCVFLYQSCSLCTTRRSVCRPVSQLAGQL